MQAAAHELQLRCAEHLPLVPLFSPATVWAHHRRVHGWRPTPTNLYPFYGDVWLEEADTALWSEVRALLADDGYGMLYTDTSTGEKRLERGVLESTGLRDDGVFAEVVEGPLRVVVFGAAEAAEHLCAYGKQLGWRTTVVDPRGGLATPERMPSGGK